MTDLRTHWLTDGQNTYAHVTTAERDQWTPLGWQDTDEPDDGFLMVWHDGIENPGRASVAYFRLSLAANGWLAGPPEGGTHPFAEPVKTAAKFPSKSAAGGNEKE